MFPCSEPLRVNIDIMFLGRTENAFDIPKFLFLADIFEIKLPEKENFFFLKYDYKTYNMKIDFVCVFGQHSVRESWWAC